MYRSRAFIVKESVQVEAYIVCLGGIVQCHVSCWRRRNPSAQVFSLKTSRAAKEEEEAVGFLPWVAM